MFYKNIIILSLVYSFVIPLLTCAAERKPKSNLFLRDSEGFLTHSPEELNKPLNCADWHQSQKDRRLQLPDNHYNNLRYVQELVAAKAAVNQTVAWGRTQPPYPLDQPLCRAVGGSPFAIVQFLVESKADVNAPSGINYDLPLHEAANGGRIDVFKLLIAHKADVTQKAGKRKNKTLADGAVQGKQWPMVGYLLQNNYLSDPVIMKLTKKEAESLLFDAACSADYYGSCIVAQHLLQIKVDPNIKNEHGQSPMQVAVRAQNRWVCKALYNPHKEPNPHLKADAVFRNIKKANVSRIIKEQNANHTLYAVLLKNYAGEVHAYKHNNKDIGIGVYGQYRNESSLYVRTELPQYYFAMIERWYAEASPQEEEKKD